MFENTLPHKAKMSLKVMGGTRRSRTKPNIEYGPSWQADNRTAGQENFHISWKMKVH